MDLLEADLTLDRNEWIATVEISLLVMVMVIFVWITAFNLPFSVFTLRTSHLPAALHICIISWFCPFFSIPFNWWIYYWFMFHTKVICVQSVFLFYFLILSTKVLHHHHSRHNSDCSKTKRGKVKPSIQFSAERHWFSYWFIFSSTTCQYVHILFDPISLANISWYHVTEQLRYFNLCPTVLWIAKYSLKGN